MTALVLQWRQSKPLIETRWRGPTGEMLAAIARDPLAVFAAVIGMPGRDGGSTATRTAGEAIGGHRAVRVDASGIAWLADAASGLDPVGVSVGAASLGQAVTIQVAGELVEPSWNWSAGPVFVGVNGGLTQAVPTAGMIFRIGTAAGATSLVIDPQLVAKL